MSYGENDNHHHNFAEKHVHVLMQNSGASTINLHWIIGEVCLPTNWFMILLFMLIALTMSPKCLLNLWIKKYYVIVSFGWQQFIKIIPWEELEKAWPGCTFMCWYCFCCHQRSDYAGLISILNFHMFSLSLRYFFVNIKGPFS